MRVGEKVIHVHRDYSITGIGIIVSISEVSKRYWVKWTLFPVRPTLESASNLQKLPEPATLLKEIL